ncbi:MAG: serine protease [Sphingomonadales bacterium]|nr:MAG: serine protease [Sphingomonadales bacterium]
MTRLLALLLALFALTLSLSIPARAADDISAASRSVVRVVTVAMVDGEVVGFGHGSGIAISPTRIITNAHVVESAAKYPDNVALGVVPSEGKKSFAGADVVALGYPGNVDLATARSANDYITPRTPTRSEGNMSNMQAVDGVAMLIHTAKISRGNSGGPLVDQCGRITGINTAITRADDGDSPFAFAISGRELMRFLADANQQYTSVGTPCVSMADADARDRAAMDAEARASAEANAAKDAAARLDRDLKQARAEEEALASRENRIALAGVLFVIGALAAGAGLLFYSQKNLRNAKIAGGAGAVLMLGAAILFVTRPDAHAEIADDAKPAASAETLKLAQGSLLCTIRPDRSRITVSATTDVPITIGTAGCVNNRTQYTRGADDRWQRILVPNDEATVTVASIDSTGRDYRVDRYLLDAETMTKARETRAAITLKSCTANPDELAGLAAQQDAIRSALPASPNERLVYRCQPASGAAIKPAAAP